MADPSDTLLVDVPDFFHRLPLVADGELDGALAALADERIPHATDGARRSWMEFCAGVIRQLRTVDARYAGVCALADGDTGTSAAALLVATAPLNFTDARVAAAGIVQVRHGTRDREARLLELPCGPAAAVVSRDQLGAAGAEPVPVNQVQFYIPWSGRRRMVMLSMASPSLADWDGYSRLAVRIARSLVLPEAV